MANPNQGTQQNPLVSLIPIILIIAVFYFFMIRPQMKKAKEQKKYIESLKVGDKIVTIGGIHGKITDVEEKTFLIEVCPNVKIRIERSAVTMDFQAQQEKK